MLAVLERWLSKPTHKSTSKSQLTTVDKNNKHMTQAGQAMLSSKHLFHFLLVYIRFVQQDLAQPSLPDQVLLDTVHIGRVEARLTDKALVSPRTLELFKGATGLSVPFGEYGRAEVRPIRGKWKPYVILMKQGAGEHGLLLQEHLLPERNVHLALIVSQPMK